MDFGPELRAEFPLFTEYPEISYLDNACMSVRPTEVIDAIGRYYTTMSACAGRSNHRLAVKVSEMVEETRKDVANFIGAKHARELLFTRNTSEGINLVAQSLAWNPGDVILISDTEHNSNLVPWLRLARQVGVVVKVIPTDDEGQFDIEEYSGLLDNSVKLVSVVQTSNLHGTTFPVKDIASMAHRVGALVLVDGAQSVPHRKVNVRDLGVDMMAFSFHKMMGPTGLGGLYVKESVYGKLDAFMVGGDTVAATTYRDYELLPPPERFEAGLQDYAGIAGAGACVRFLSQFDMNKLHRHEVQLNRLIQEGLASEERIHVLGSQDPNLRGGIFSFRVEGVDYHQLALMLDQQYAVLVRSGQHCVHSWFADRGISGSVRASLYGYTTEQEVERFVSGVKQLLTVL